MKEHKILIIGSGITGITLADRFASNGNKVLIIEKRNHIGVIVTILKTKKRIIKYLSKRIVCLKNSN